MRYRSVEKMKVDRHKEKGADCRTLKLATRRYEVPQIPIVQAAVDETKRAKRVEAKPKKKQYIIINKTIVFAIDHRTKNIGLPVRSAVLKLRAGWLVVGWVTTSESPLLIVFDSSNILGF